MRDVVEAKVRIVSPSLPFDPTPWIFLPCCKDWSRLTSRKVPYSLGHMIPHVYHAHVVPSVGSGFTWRKDTFVAPLSLH